MATVPTAAPTRYVTPGRADRFFNAAVAWLTDRGVSLFGSRVLTVPGRTSGQPRSTPVNLMGLDGERYLVAPRGNTQWVRNVRAAGGHAVLRRRRARRVLLEELPVEERAPVIAAYLEQGRRRGGATTEAGQARSYFGLEPGAPVDEVARVSDRYPVLRISEDG